MLITPAYAAAGVFFSRIRLVPHDPQPNFTDKHSHGINPEENNQCANEIANPMKRIVFSSSVGGGINCIDGTDFNGHTSNPANYHPANVDGNQPDIVFTRTLEGTNTGDKTETDENHLYTGSFFHNIQ
jgi:hypothetical protein